MDLVGHPCVSFLALLEELEDHISLNDGVLEHLCGSLLLYPLRADQQIQELE